MSKHTRKAAKRHHGQFGKPASLLWPPLEWLTWEPPPELLTWELPPEWAEWDPPPEWDWPPIEWGD